MYIFLLVQKSDILSEGVDWNGPISEDDDNIVEVPEIDNSLLENSKNFKQ